MSKIFHNIYQKEAKRQGDVRHADKYEDLPENIKEFDRVLARYVSELLKQSILEILEEIETAVVRDKMGYDYIQEIKEQLTK